MDFLRCTCPRRSGSTLGREHSTILSSTTQLYVKPHAMLIHLIQLSKLGSLMFLIVDALCSSWVGTTPIIFLFSVSTTPKAIYFRDYDKECFFWSFVVGIQIVLPFSEQERILSQVRLSSETFCGFPSLIVGWSRFSMCIFDCIPHKCLGLIFIRQPQTCPRGFLLPLNMQAQVDWCKLMLVTYDTFVAMDFQKNRNLNIKKQYYRYLHNFLEYGVRI